ncbi:hypothetical protein [Microbacterium sp. bgisy203]|uniref:hypothetical protein n=1 Tax=Microbacterium sp. bgisy203 TaxID=3413799 RepID=UPI003D73E205
MNTRGIERRATGAVAGFAGFALVLLIAVAWVVVETPASAAITDDATEYTYQYVPGSTDPVYVYAEQDKKTVTVSQAVRPRAGKTDDGSAVIYLPPLGESFTISDVTDGGMGKTLCRLDAVAPGGLSDGACSWVAVQFSGTGADRAFDGAHVRVDGLDHGSHTFVVSTRTSSSTFNVQRVTFEIPRLSR